MDAPNNFPLKDLSSICIHGGTWIWSMFVGNCWDIPLKMEVVMDTSILVLHYQDPIIQ